eukprot:TRINITY_DN541_c4_g1_i3.p1 TRINITY_DN541_c4_g1~~TRINITY_DN541_c4_g1_i3.p1  ORF type:complete len:1029 (-),score=272.98 TRINITY_DN541_c4_g1_i3:1569-4595(-)
MEPETSEMLLSPEVSVPKPLGKISFAAAFDAATQIHYRPSIVLLSDIFAEDNLKEKGPISHEPQSGADAEETTEDDENDVEEETEEDLKALLEDATGSGAILSDQKRQRTPLKRFDPHQELREKVATFKKEKRQQLEKEILARTGNPTLSDNELSEIRKLLQAETAAFLKEQDATGDLEWYQKNIVQQPIKDELYHTVSEMFAFADQQGYSTDQSLLEAMLVDADSLGFLGLAPEVLSATPTKKEKTDMEKRALRLEAIKKVFGDVIFGEYSRRNLPCIAANQFGELLTPSDWKELTDAVEKARKDLLQTLEEGRNNDSVDCLAYQAALETCSESYIAAIAYLNYARILGFWRERQTIATFLTSPATVAQYANGDKKEWQKKEEYHLLHIVVESLGFFEDLIRDYLDTIDNFAVDIFDLNEEEENEVFSDVKSKSKKSKKHDEDEEDDDGEDFDDDLEDLMNSVTFLPPFPGEEEEFYDDDEEDEEGEEDDEEAEEDEEDEESDLDDLSEAEEVDDDEEEEELSPFESPMSKKSKRPAPAAAKKTPAAKAAPKIVAPPPPVDPHFPNKEDGHRVHVDANGTPYSVLLNQSDLTGTNSKFYVIQVVVGKGSDWESYNLFTRWGRAEDVGMHKLEPVKGVQTAVAMFEKKFFEKTANRWSPDIQSKFTGRPGKYVCIFPTLGQAGSTPAPNSTSTTSARSPAASPFGRSSAKPSSSPQTALSGAAPAAVGHQVDQFLPASIQAGARVFVENSQGQPFVWSVSLTKGSASDTCKIQLIEELNGNFGVFFRDSPDASNATYKSFATLQEAKNEFCSIFRRRTGNEWTRETAQHGFSPIPGLYSMPFTSSSSVGMPNIAASSPVLFPGRTPKRARKVDPMAPEAAHYEVFVDEAGLAWDVNLCQINIAMNNNRFYMIQLLSTAASAPKEFAVWSRWGRGTFIDPPLIFFLLCHDYSMYSKDPISPFSACSRNVARFGFPPLSRLIIRPTSVELRLKTLYFPPWLQFSRILRLF